MEDHEVIAEHLHLISKREPRIAERIYERFFERHPQLEKLFGKFGAAVQQDMLTETLVGAVDSLEEMPWLESNLELLGAKHVEFDVSTEMYDWWANCILETLADLSGSDWTPRLERLWRERMDYICSLMRKGAEQVA